MSKPKVGDWYNDIRHPLLGLEVQGVDDEFIYLGLPYIAADDGEPIPVEADVFAAEWEPCDPPPTVREIARPIVRALDTEASGDVFEGLVGVASAFVREALRAYGIEPREES